MRLRALRHWILFTGGYLLLRKGRWHEAASAFRRAIELFPEHPWSHNHLGIALLKLGRWEEAARVCQRAMSLNPKAFDAHMNFGIALLKLARWNEAVAAYERAIQLYPGSAPLYEKLGLAFSRLEHWGDAAAAFRRAIDLGGEAPETSRFLGASLVNLGRFPEAASAYRRALSLHPRDLESYPGLATAIAMMESRPEAVAAHERSVARASSDAAEHLGLGVELLKLGRWEEAVVAFQKGRSLLPESAAFHFLIVSPLIKLGRVREGGEAYQRALEIGGVFPLLPGGSPSARSEQRRASFWTPENLGERVFRIERWLERLVSEAASSDDGASRLLFVLDNDYGELTTLMYLMLGQPLLPRTTLLLPHRLSTDNAGALPGRTHRYDCLEDIVEVVERERPAIVFLCSGYLFSIHGILSLDSLERLVRLLQDRGCRVVTSDPFLGMLSRRSPHSLISIDIPDESSDDSRARFRSEDLENLKERKRIEDERLRTHLSRSERILRNAYHLYPTYCDVPEHLASATDSRNLCFFNSELVCPELSTSATNAGGVPHWLFILSRTDLDAQMMFESGPGFADIVAGKLIETLAAGRHPVFIGPNELLELLAPRLPITEGIDLQPYCSFNRLMSLLLAAEYAFYWNVLSHSILIRLFNKLPVIVFDRGHLVRNVTAMYDWVVGWYYQGWEPGFYDHRKRLTLEAVSAHAEAYRREADRMLARFGRAPAPVKMIEGVIAAE